MTTDKEALASDFRRMLTERAEALRATQQAAKTGMRVDEGHRPANRGERAAVTSQGYLAAGMAERLASVEHHLALLGSLEFGPRQRVGAGALVRVEQEDGNERLYFLVPGAQGDALDGGVTALSPESPLACAMIGLEEGDSCQVMLQGRELELAILAVG